MRFHAAVIMLKRAQKIQQTLIMHSSKYAASKLNNRVLNYFRIITSHAALHSLILAELLNASYFSPKKTHLFPHTSHMHLHSCTPASASASFGGKYTFVIFRTIFFGSNFVYSLKYIFRIFTSRPANLERHNLKA